MISGFAGTVARRRWLRVKRRQKGDGFDRAVFSSSRARRAP